VKSIEDTSSDIFKSFRPQINSKFNSDDEYHDIQRNRRISSPPSMSPREGDLEEQQRIIDDELYLLFFSNAFWTLSPGCKYDPNVRCVSIDRL
jgi:hypothetical protein